METWRDELFVLKNGGFTDEEIADRAAERRDELSAGGFTPKEVDEYFGVKEPDMKPVKDLITNNLKAAAEKPKPEGKSQEQADSFLEALDAGFQVSSSAMLYKAGRGKSVTPDMVIAEDAPMFYRIASQVGTIAGDLPAMVAGALAGAPAGAAAGTAVAPGPGTAAGALIGGGAGGNALPEAIRASLMEYYEKGEIQDFSDFWGRTSAVFLDTLKSGVVGGATAGVGGKVAKVVKPVASVATQRIATATSEIATMVSVGKAMEGEAPTARDFTDAAILVGGLGVATKTASKLRTIYAKTGTHPAEILQEAQSNPVLKQELIMNGDDIPSLLPKVQAQSQLVQLQPEADGVYRFKTFRGKAASGKANDYGVAGQGEYSSSNYDTALSYADGDAARVTEQTVELKKPLILEYGELNELQRQTVGKMVTGFDKDSALAFDKWMREQGYDGAVLFDLEISKDVPQEVVKLGSKPISTILDGEASAVKPDAPELPATAQDKILSKIGEKVDTPKRKHSWSDYYKDFFDRLDPIQNAIKELGVDPKSLTTEGNPYQLARMASDSKAKVKHMFERGVIDYKTLETTGKSFNEIIKPFGEDLGGLKAYLISKRAVELEARGVKSGFDLAAAQEVVSKGEATYSKAASELVEFQNGVLKYLKDSGALSEKTFQTLVETGKNYVSFKRVTEEGKVSKTGRGSPIKKIKGSELDIQDPFISMIENADVYVKLAEANRSKRAMVELAEAAGDTTLFEKVPPRMKEVTVSKSEVAKLFASKGIDADPEAFSIFRADSKDLAPNEFDVFRDGKREVYRTTPEIAEAFKVLEGNTTAKSMVYRIARGITTAKRIGISLMPDFVLRNFIRDQITAGVFSKTNTKITDVFKTAIDTVVAMGDIGKKSDTYYNWLKAGGANGAFIELRDIDSSVYKLNQETGFMDKTWNLIKKPVEYMELAGSLAEQATRLAEFKRVTKGAASGAKVFEGGFASREITVDFQRVGAKVSAMNAITAFMNVSMQGLDRSVRALKEDPTGIAKRAGLLITAPSIYLWWANKDDERYKEIPRWQKDMFWIIPTDNWVEEEIPGEAINLPEHLKREGKNGRMEINKGTIFRIPKPQELGILFGSLPERVLEKFFTENPGAMKDFDDTLMNLITPSVIPDIAAPAVEQFFNKSFFTDSKLVPGHLEGVLPQYQYTDYTSEMGRRLGKMIAAVPLLRDIGPDSTPISSPMVIENYIQSWSGTMGKYALQAADQVLIASGVAEDPNKPSPSLADIPFVKAFVVRNPTASTKSIGDFYNKFEESERVLKSFKLLIKSGEIDEAMALSQDADYEGLFNNLSGTKQAMSNIGALIRTIYKDPNTPPGEKRQMIDGLYFTMTEVAKGGLMQAREFEKAIEDMRKQKGN
jgi:hypothetical protein